MCSQMWRAGACSNMWSEHFVSEMGSLGLVLAIGSTGLEKYPRPIFLEDCQRQTACALERLVKFKNLQPNFSGYSGNRLVHFSLGPYLAKQGHDEADPRLPDCACNLALLFAQVPFFGRFGVAGGSRLAQAGYCTKFPRAISLEACSYSGPT